MGLDETARAQQNAVESDMALRCPASVQAAMKDGYEIFYASGTKKDGCWHDRVLG